MPFYRVLVQTQHSSQLAALHIVNTFYLNDSGVTTDPENLANSAAEAFATYRNFPADYPSVLAKIYDMADAEPREPKAEAVEATTQGALPMGPPEVALCLSYFAERNRPRQRGRLYIGPWFNQMGSRPVAAEINELADLAQRIADLGGVDVQWHQYSPTANEHRQVTDWWVDNEWDVIRSRGLGATARTTGSIEG